MKSSIITALTAIMMMAVTPAVAQEENGFKKFNVKPHVIFRSRPQTLLGAAAAKKSIALLDRLHANMFRTPADIALVPFSPTLKCAVGIAVDEDKADDPIIQELIDALAQA